MTNEEAIKELTKFVKLKTTLEPSFLSVAIAALEKQIAKKPTEDEYGHKCCPLCSWTVDDFWCYDRIKIPHCKYCGQALDWGPDESGE